MTSRPRAQTAAAGYTIIEVMMAIAILVVGAVGILALQRAATRANAEAREQTTATQITRRWLEILRRDGLRWTQRGSAGLLGTQYLNAVPTSPTAVGPWFTPLGADPTAFGYDGLPAGGGRPAHFCVNVRLSWTLPQEAIRADVRTWWHRRASSLDAAYGDRRLYAGCGPGAEAAVTNEIFGTYRLRATQAATVIRWRLLQ
ncbi:MAG: prepilin-type N-terminal cleavage/methylation domain-containing protein [Myxococcota bacterium]|nr:prepilin-type N-terminal cleavage/methylation domain-containing protein [Myxococcota bacterium]MDW8362384.1 prepilin-type N-terminal cleavage/methylation domain-containing protein [Myxococcales bacterium]